MKFGRRVATVLYLKISYSTTVQYIQYIVFYSAAGLQSIYVRMVTVSMVTLLMVSIVQYHWYCTSASSVSLFLEAHPTNNNQYLRYQWYLYLKVWKTSTLIRVL